ncbi:MAG: 4Fe-4S binding protein [Moorella humiferrea]|nr:4Fe-4S binding protein [Moorella humiferrea]
MGKLDLESIANSLAGLGQVRLKSDACIRGKSPWATCNYCRDVCPVGGIELAKGYPEIRECQRCGLCAVACPTGALADPERTHSFYLARGQESIAATGWACFTCSRQAEEQKRDEWIAASCLGAVAPEVMVALAVKGQVAFSYHTDRCAACPWGPKGEEVFLASFNWAQKTIASVGLSEQRLYKGSTFATLSSNRKNPGNGTGYAYGTAAMGRREFFRSLVRGIKLQGIKVELASSPSAQLVNVSRTAILQRAVMEARPTGGYSANACLELASLEITGPCYLCNICSRLCPAGALQLIEGELKFYPARCTHCGLCQAVCPHHSLSWGENLSLEMVAADGCCILATATEHRCNKCGETFRANLWAEECMRCALNRQLPGSGAGKEGG